MKLTLERDCLREINTFFHRFQLVLVRHFLPASTLLHSQVDAFYSCSIFSITCVSLRSVKLNINSTKSEVTVPFFVSFPQVMLFYTTSLIAVLMFARGLSHVSFTRHITRVVQYHADWKTHHPCDGSVNNGTIPTGKYLILCIVPTEEELREQLKDIGGLNRHYAAVTKKEADNFTNLLPGPQPPIPDGEEKPFLIIWSHLTSALSRNRKAVSRDADLENNIVNSKKVGCVYRGGRTEFGMIRLCTECQRVSKLSPDRFPRYINEVACDEEIPSRHKGKLCCKKNQGRCIQRFILSDFLVSTENYVEVPSPNPEKFSKAFKQVWEPYTQKIRSCCEFQLW